MTVDPSCPPLERFQQLLAGHPADEEGEALALHLEKCETCGRRVEQLMSEDLLGRAMRSRASTLVQPADATVLRLMARLAEMGGPAVSVPLAPPSCDFLSPGQGPDELGRLAHYRILRLLGHGGMGLVFLAEDTQLQRPVALKVLKPEVARESDALQRFLREARAAAALKNDHVVTIHQVGQENEVSFLAMEYLRGVSLADWLDEGHRATMAQVLSWGRQIAEGLAAAHARGLIHRDIKPANVWLESGQGDTATGQTAALESLSSSPGLECRVKILDFGLVRGAGENLRLTRSGYIMGTPAYMAPEQACGGAVDARADLFSLGCLLYELCTGRLPFEAPNTYALLTALATETPAPLRSLNPEVPAALAELVMQLLARSPQDRPASARAVAEALRSLERNQLTGSPLPASVARRPPRRWWLAGLAAVAAGVVLLAGWAIIIRHRDGSQTRIESTHEPAPVRPAIPLGPVPADALRRDHISPAALAAVAGGEPGFALEGLVAVLGDGRFRISGDSSLFTFSPDGKTLAAPSGNDVRLFDAATGELRRVLRGSPSRVLALAFAPDGRQLASVGDQGIVKVWELASGRAVWGAQLVVQPPARGTVLVHDVLFSKDGRQVITAEKEGPIRFWDSATGKPGRVLAEPVGLKWKLTLSPDGAVLAATNTQRGAVHLWDLASGQLLRSLAMPADTFARVAFSPDGKRLAAGTDLGVRVWDCATWALERELAAPAAGLLAFSPDNQVLWTGRYLHHEQQADPLHTARRWQAATGKELPALRLADREDAARYTLRPDGKVLAAMGVTTRRIRLWDTDTGRELLAPEGHTWRIRALAVSTDGRTLVSGGTDGTVCFWDLGTGGRRLTWNGGRDISFLEFTSDGRTLLVATSDGVIRLLDVAIVQAGKGDPVRHTLPTHSPPGWLRPALSPDGRTVAAGDGAGAVRFWDVVSGRLARVLPLHAKHIPAVTYSPDGKWLASVGADQTARIIDLATDQPLLTWKTPDEAGLVSFSPDGRQLAVAAVFPKGTVHIHDTADAKELAALSHPSVLMNLTWAPDSRRLVTVCFDSAVTFWSLRDTPATARLLLPSSGRGAGAVVFTPEGRHLIATNADGTLYVLRLAAP